MKKLTQIFCLVTCVLMMAAVAINRDHKIMGHEMGRYNASAEADSAADDSAAIMKTLDDGTVVVNTSTLGKDIKGYGGTTPLMISIRNGKIIDIKAMPNSESPEFFGEASSLFKTWIGKSVGEADSTEVDAVSGATYSSRAIIGNMRVALDYVMTNQTKKKSEVSMPDVSLKTIAVVIVALMAAVLPLFIKNRRYHLVQLILNVIVLGFWSGTFISYSLLTSYLSNGMNVLTSLPAVILLITAIVYPLLGKHQYYCTNVCPFGSLQQIAGRCGKRKIKIQPRIANCLAWFRRILWAVLMLLMWCGVFFQWMDYEPFTAFILTSASWIVIAIAALFIILSAFIPRPYCRFVCPTGTLLKISEHIK